MPCSAHRDLEGAWSWQAASANSRPRSRCKGRVAEFSDISDDIDCWCCLCRGQDMANAWERVIQRRCRTPSTSPSALPRENKPSMTSASWSLCPTTRSSGKQAQFSIGRTIASTSWTAHHGWPIKRRRLHGVALNKETVKWVGPETEEAIRLDYKRRFHKSTCISGDILFTSDAEERFEEKLFYAKQQRNASYMETFRAMTDEEPVVGNFAWRWHGTCEVGVGALELFGAIARRCVQVRRDAPSVTWVRCWIRLACVGEELSHCVPPERRRKLLAHHTGHSDGIFQCHGLAHSSHRPVRVSQVCCGRVVVRVHAATDQNALQELHASGHAGILDVLRPGEHHQHS